MNRSVVRTRPGVYFNTVASAATPFAVNVTFSSVSAPGETLITAASGSPAITVPAAFTTATGGYSATFVDVTTTAVRSGAVETCIAYPDVDQNGLVDGTSTLETAVRLLHEGSGTFVDRTSALRTDLNQVCASTTSPSYFVPALSTAITIPTLSPIQLTLLGVLCLSAGMLLRRGMALRA